MQAARQQSHNRRMVGSEEGSANGTKPERTSSTHMTMDRCSLPSDIFAGSCGRREEGAATQRLGKKTVAVHSAALATRCCAVSQYNAASRSARVLVRE